MTWMDLIDDGQMVDQSVANWTAARVQASSRYHERNGQQHGSQGAGNVNCGRDCDHECGQNCGISCQVEPRHWILGQGSQDKGCSATEVLH